MAGKAGGLQINYITSVRLKLKKLETYWAKGILPVHESCPYI